MDAKGRESEPVCIADEVPFEVPEGWEWTRLEELASFSGGKTPSTNDRSNYEPNGILWVTSKDMKRDFIDSTLITLSEKGASELTLYPVGTILMVTRSGILRRLLPVAMLVKEATVNQDQKAICPFNKAISRWLLTFFKASDHRIRADFGKAGMTVESIVFDKVKTMLVPLPPLAEQRRIVAKVEELMPLVEQYGALEDERERLDAALPNALRKSILQEAVEGRLVPQDASDEPASALLVRIREERRKMVADGKLRPPKGGESVIFAGSDGRRYEKRVDAKGRESEPVCIEDEIPFEVPEGWEWARLGALVDMQAGKNIAASKIAGVKDADHPYPCFGGNGVRGFVSRPNRRGWFPIIGRQGARCGCINYAKGDFYATEHAVVVTCSGDVNVEWCGIMLEALNLNQYATATAQPGLAVSKIAQLLVPLPPLAEQRCIVERVQELFDTID